MRLTFDRQTTELPKVWDDVLDLNRLRKRWPVRFTKATGIPHSKRSEGLRFVAEGGGGGEKNPQGFFAAGAFFFDFLQDDKLHISHGT